MSYLKMIELSSPEIILTIALFLILTVDLFIINNAGSRVRMLVSASISIIGCVLAIAFIGSPTFRGALEGGILVLFPLTNWVKIALIICAIITILISVESLNLANIGEYYAMLLLSLIGMLFLVSSENLLMVFISLELVGISLYILTAFYKGNRNSVEAGFKYFVFGGITSAIFLFGLSIIYGLTGSLELKEIVRLLPVNSQMPLLMLALAMIVVGFGFKIAAAPFHLWAPDVYQCAPLPTTAFIASGSKLAAFYFFSKLMVNGFENVSGRAGWSDFSSGWLPMFSVIAIASVVIGNVTAIVQKEVRRLLAYSAVAQAGYMLLGSISCANYETRFIGMNSLIYYAITYSLTMLGAFACVVAVENNFSKSSFSEFSGLYKKSPLLSFAMVVFLLSLAGIPPLSGFLGKFYLFSTTARMDQSQLKMMWIVIVAVLMSAVSLYYYLLVLKQIFVKEPQNDKAFIVPTLLKLVIVFLAIAVVVFGIFPELMFGYLGLNNVVKSGF